MKAHFAPRSLAVVLAIAAFDTGRAGLSAPEAAANVDYGIADEHLAKAKKFFDQRKLREASIELKNALRKNPDNAEARLLLGKIAIIGRDLDTAEKEISRALALKPSDEATVLLGEIYIQRDEPEKALVAVEGSAATTEMQIQRLVVAATALVSLKRHDEAEARYRDILSLDGNRIEGHFGLARVFAARRDFDRANAKIDEIAAARPDYPPVWILRGEVALSRGDRVGAVRAFDRAAELEPDNAIPVISRARANLSIGNISAAKEDARRLSQLAPDAPMTNYIKAAIAFAEGDYDGANRQFTQLQRYFDDFAPAVLLGALIKNERKELNQADALLMKYIGLEPDNLDAKRALAQVRLRMGNASNASDILEKLLAVTPDDTASLRQLASAYIATDRFDAAREALERLSESGTPDQAEQARTSLAMLDGRVAEQTPELRDSELRIGLLKATDSLLLGNVAVAEQQVALLKPRYGDTASVLAIEGGIAAAQGRTADARKLLDAALQEQPELLAAIVAAESLDRQSGDTRASAERLRVLLNRAPQSEALSLRLADRLVELGDWDDAIAMLQQQSQRVPESGAIRKALISRLLLANRPEEAARAAVDAAQMPGAEIDLIAFASGALIDVKAGDAAVQVARKLVDLSENSPRASAVYAEALLVAGRNDEAFRVLDAAQAKAPKDTGLAVTYVNLAVGVKDAAAAQRALNVLAQHDRMTATRLQARALGMLNQPVVAVEVLEKAFAGAPDGTLAVDLFNARRRAGRDEQAFAGLREWTEGNPSDRGALIAYASGLMESGQTPEAEAAYGAFLALEPGNPVALNNYAWLRHEAGRPDALDFAQRAFRAAPGSAEITDTYGWMLVQYGKLADGLQLLRRAASAAPENAEIGYHLAQALAKAGKLTEARNVLSAALAKPGEFSARSDAEALLATLR